MVKPMDVPVFVEQGAADLGIAGLDAVGERAADVYEPLLLPFGHCRSQLPRPGDRPQGARWPPWEIQAPGVGTKLFPRLGPSHISGGLWHSSGRTLIYLDMGSRSKLGGPVGWGLNWGRTLPFLGQDYFIPKTRVATSLGRQKTLVGHLAGNSIWPFGKGQWFHPVGNPGAQCLNADFWVRPQEWFPKPFGWAQTLGRRGWGGKTHSCGKPPGNSQGPRGATKGDTQSLGATGETPNGGNFRLGTQGLGAKGTLLG